MSKGNKRPPTPKEKPSHSKPSKRDYQSSKTKPPRPQETQTKPPKKD